MITQREYDEIELNEMRWRLADVTNPGRQVPPTTAGQDYRERLREDIKRLEARLSSEDE